VNEDADEKRPCTPGESLEQSLKEMQEMRKCAIPKRSWKELKLDLAKPVRISLKNKKIPVRKIIRVQTSPATKKLNNLNRLILELFGG